MPSFSVRHPFFIIVICLFVCLLDLTGLIQMPVGMFPPIKITVLLATAAVFLSIPLSVVIAFFILHVGTIVALLIVDFANVLSSEGRELKQAVVHACRIRLRPILMTSLATVVGLLPTTFNIGGLVSSILLKPSLSFLRLTC